MLRMMGDNGKPNDNMLMHILSPYPSHRSALTDLDKLSASGFKGRKAVLIYGYDYDECPMMLAVDAFEVLTSARGRLTGFRVSATFDHLLHPVHRRGAVYGGKSVAKQTVARRVYTTLAPTRTPSGD